MGAGVLIVGVLRVGRWVGGSGDVVLWCFEKSASRRGNFYCLITEHSGDQVRCCTLDVWLSFVQGRILSYERYALLWLLNLARAACRAINYKFPHASGISLCNLGPGVLMSNAVVVTSMAPSKSEITERCMVLPCIVLDKGGSTRARCVDTLCAHMAVH